MIGDRELRIHRSIRWIARIFRWAAFRRTGIPQLQVLEDPVDHGCLVDDGDHLHLGHAAPKAIGLAPIDHQLPDLRSCAILGTAGPVKGDDLGTELARLFSTHCDQHPLPLSLAEPTYQTDYLG